MIDFYFAGNHTTRIREWVRDNDANALASYMNDRSAIQHYFSYKKVGWKGKLMIDNGAFTVHRQGGKVDIDEYIKWLNDNDEYIDYAIALDDIPGKPGVKKTEAEVIKSSEVTYANYLYMKERVKSPQKLLPVFHQGDKVEFLERYLKMKDLKYMCLSGNKINVTSEQRNVFYSMCFDVVRKCGREDMNFHCLGSATFNTAERFPFASMDATSHIQKGMYGLIICDYGTIYVGDKNLISNMHEEEFTVLKDLCDRYNVDIYKLADDWLERTVFCMGYMKELSHKIEYVKPKSIKRRLF